MINRIQLLLLWLILLPAQAWSQVSQERTKLVRETVAYFNSKQYTSALAGFDKLIQLDPADYVSWVSRGRTLHHLNREQEAFESFNKALSINPAYYEGYSYRGTLYGLNGQTELALRDISLALQGMRNDTTLLLLRAGYFLKTRKFDSAILDCNYVLQLYPQHAAALYCRGTAFKKSGKLDKALDDFNRSIHINPNDPETHNDRGYLLMGQEHFDLAMADFTASIQLAGAEDSTAKAYAYNNRGFCAYKTGHLDEALKDVNHSIELLGSNSYAYKNRALIFLQLNQPAAACRDLEMSLNLGFTRKFGDEVTELQTRHCK